MARRTLLVIFSSIKETNNENTKIISKLFKHFYKVPLDEIPNEIPDEIFPLILHNPSSENLLMSLHADTLVFILSTKDKIAYIGVIRDALSRQWSIELPIGLTWNELMECAKQTSQSPISFA
jgi:hypothetical protein